MTGYSIAAHAALYRKLTKLKDREKRTDPAQRHAIQQEIKACKSRIVALEGGR